MTLQTVRPHSALATVFVADYLIFPFRILLLPYATGIDLAIWTVGSLMWLGSDSSWPGAALSLFLTKYPNLAWVVMVTFTFIGAIILVGILFLLFGLFNKVWIKCRY